MTHRDSHPFHRNHAPDTNYMYCTIDARKALARVAELKKARRKPKARLMALINRIRGIS